MKEKESHFFLNTIIFIVIIITMIFLYAKYIGIKGIEVKEYKVESNILSENFSGVKIVHFSDLLYKSTINDEDVLELVDKINLLKPDIVVFTGDLVNKNIKLNEKEREFLINSLSNINVTIGKYAIYGDYDFEYEYDYIMSKSDFIILDNEYEEIFYKTNESIYLVGLPSSIKENIYMNDAFKFYDENNRKYVIVLIHDGNTIRYIDESNYEVDLILGGHSLNGSIVLPFYGGLFKDKYSYKYVNNYYSKGITNIYISSGLGTNDYKYRFNNKPSFNLYRLKSLK